MDGIEEEEEEEGNWESRDDAYVGLAYVGSDRYRCIVINDVGEDGEGETERERIEAYARARRFIGYEDL